MKGEAVNQGWIRLAVAGVWLFVCCATAGAQMLAGDWVQVSEKRIDEQRKTDLRVIVLDANGKPASGVDVRVEQTRSNFYVGVVLPETGWTYEADVWGADEPFWRCVNAVSLERMTGWPVLEPEDGGTLDADRLRMIDRTLDIASDRGLFVRWGPLISADPGRVPGWAASLEHGDLARAVTAYTDSVWWRYGGRVHQYDVYTQTLDHNFIESRAGLALVRNLYAKLPARSDGAAACTRFDDAMVIGRLQKMQRQLTAMREAFIPFGVVAIDHRFTGTLDRRTLERLVGRIDAVDSPLILSNLSVGGDNALNAAINLELVLRTLMEQRNVQGIWFADLTPESAADPNSALIDEQGQPTAPGKLIDNLYHDLWRTQIQASADELGNVRARAFPGNYRVTATLADGTVIETEFRLVKSQDPRVVLLEPLRASGAQQPAP